jgi:hypothetical protein
MQNHNHNDNDVIQLIKVLLSESKDIEASIETLRDNNYSKMESIEVMRKVLNISYDESYELVRNSITWSDTKEYDDKLMDDFFDILEESDDLMT